MSVTAALVKELRDRTGLGMMECKKALVETDGNIDLAIENLRKAGQAKAAKKAGRTAAEGVVIARVAESGANAVLVEINSETDFVARDDNFLGFCNQVADHLVASDVQDVSALMGSEMGGQPIETVRQGLVQKIGENIQVRRFNRIAVEGGVIGSYVHHNGKIGVVVSLKGGDAALAKDIAMHVAASSPVVVSPDQVDPALVEKEREIFSAQAAESGKPAEIIAKMVEGRVGKFLKEVSLNEQPFVKDPNTTVGKLASAAGAEVLEFVRIEVGEGIEKEEVDFAAEVAAQVQSV